MSNLFFTADTHFSHSNIIKYCNRPFKHAEEMDTALIRRWNSIVTPEDVVYHLGDFSLCSHARAKAFFDQLNGTKHLIIGNHDSNAVKKLEWGSIDKLTEFEFTYTSDDKELTLFLVLGHYPLDDWNNRFFGSLMLHGHCHGKSPKKQGRLDVGVDCNGFRPISLDEVITKMYWGMVEEK